MQHFKCLATNRPVDGLQPQVLDFYKETRFAKGFSLLCDHISNCWEDTAEFNLQTAPVLILTWNKGEHLSLTHIPSCLRQWMLEADSLLLSRGFIIPWAGSAHQDTSHPSFIGMEALNQEGIQAGCMSLLHICRRENNLTVGRQVRTCKNSSSWHMKLALIMMGSGEVRLEAGKELTRGRAVCWGEVGVHCTRLSCGFPFCPFISSSLGSHHKRLLLLPFSIFVWTVSPSRHGLYLNLCAEWHSGKAPSVGNYK